MSELLKQRIGTEAQAAPAAGKQVILMGGSRMSILPLAYADSLRIGSIDFVSPDEIKVLLDIEAPDNLALNTGTPRPFPRINGYVLSQ
jgi:hypothetical protein